MPISSTPQPWIPDYWRVFGHSYFQMVIGTRTQAGRADSAVRSAFDIEFNNWENHACNGAMLMNEGLPQGGYARVLQGMPGPSNDQHIGPYPPMGGATIMCYGINDLGGRGDTTQYRSAFEYALEGVISRARMSTVREDNTGASAAQGSIAYGAGWTQLAFSWDFSGGNTIRQCTTTVAATITITLPSDYQGQPICLWFACNAGAVGGTITFSGTAGVTGTHVVSNIQNVATLQHTPRPKRITTLTSANASQTIICTTTQIDASGIIYFDGFWLESLVAPPVLVCNIAKLNSTGYDVYALMAANSDATNHAQVDTWNGIINTVVARFDSMVQVVDCDAAIDIVNLGSGANATMSFDGLHPTEYGAARIAAAVRDAVSRLRPTTALGMAPHINPQSKRSAAMTQPYRHSLWYTSETTSGATGTSAALVAQDMWAIPFFVSQGQMQISQWGLERVTSTVTATVFFAIFDDRQMKGYPQYQYVAPANVTALSTGTGVGAFQSSTTPGNNGYILQPMDPGLYWLVLKCVVAGTNTFRFLAGNSRWMPNLTSGGLGNVQYTGYKLTGQGTSAMFGRFPDSAVATAQCPMISVKTDWIGERGIGT